MILHEILIRCSPTGEPDLTHAWHWSAGGSVFSVECAITKLQEWVDEQKKIPTPLAVALAPDNNKPIA